MFNVCRQTVTDVQGKNDDESGKKNKAVKMGEISIRNSSDGDRTQEQLATLY